MEDKVRKKNKTMLEKSREVELSHLGVNNSKETTDIFMSTQSQDHFEIIF